MTDNMKAFMEEASKDREFVKKTNNARTKEAVIALAKEKGFQLTEADFETPETEGEVSLDEAAAVAGGNNCFCAVGGGGTGDDDTNHDTCGCVALGMGFYDDGMCRCNCPFVGSGD